MNRRNVVPLIAAIALSLPIRSHGATGCDMHKHAAAAKAAPPQNGSAIVSIPDITVLTQDGRPVRFYGDLIKGKVVAVNFVYTTCTTVCPPMGAMFANLQKRNAARMGKDTFLVSVSIDPAVDTPARLKAWSQKFGARAGWTLVTGSRDDITRILKSMNAYVANFTDHQPLTLVGNDAAGVWKRVYGFTPVAKLTAMLDEVRSAKEHAE